ncbi:MAG: 40S ribosomal protein S19 [Candidatus Micrarchaeota archaeon]
MTALDVPANELIANAAQVLKAEYGTTIVPPVWVMLVKSGSHKERPPQDAEFWYKRCASLLYNSYKNGTIGVRKLRKKYGARTQHIVRRSHHRQAGGKIIRLAFQQLEKAGLMKLEKLKTQVNPAKPLFAGRVISPQGRKLLDKAAVEVAAKK